MADSGNGAVERIGYRARSTLGRIELLALYPLLVLAADWFGFDNIALVTALGLSLLLALALVLPDRRYASTGSEQPLSGKAGLIDALARICSDDSKDTVCLLIQVDAWADVADTWGHDSAQGIAARIKDRLKTALRAGDQIFQLGDARFGVVLAGMSAARLGLRDMIASRLSDAIKEPLALNGTVVRLTGSIGHSSIRRRASNMAEATFKAAEAALSEATLQGRGSIRAFSSGMGRARHTTSMLSGEVEEAIQSNAIDTWFQPQVCARTGCVSGIETFARWQHPQHGLLGPAELLPAVQASGQMRMLNTTFIHRALKALSDWDAADAHVPTVSLNMSVTELQDTKLAETLVSETQRYSLTPERIAIEISGRVLEEQLDDALISNLTALKVNGHLIYLDSAGLGSVPLLLLQRFGVSRMKIDRSFVLGVETDTHKDQAIRAMVALASEMDMETIAKGVETRQEIEHLAKLGCNHLQGFGIARPMKADKVADWVRARAASGKTIRLESKRAS